LETREEPLKKAGNAAKRTKLPLKRISSERDILSTKPGDDGKRIDYVVRGEPCLRLRVGKDRTGEISRIWSFLYTRASDGEKRRVTLPRYPDMSFLDARKTAARYRVAVFDGYDPAGDVARSKGGPLVEGVAAQWLEKHVKRKLRSWPEIERTLKHDVFPQIGGMKIDFVVRQDIREMVNKIADKGSPIQANRVLSTVSSFYRWAVKNDIAAENPALGVDKPSEEMERVRCLSHDEIRMFWRGCDREISSVGNRDILKLCLLLGQSVNEIAQAPKSEFNLNAGIWEIPASRTKNRRLHRLPLPPMATGILTCAFERTPSSAYVFPTRSLHFQHVDKPQISNAVSQLWVNTRGAIGLEDVRVHDLRRTFASLAGDAGLPDYEIGLVLNHSTARSRTTSIYNRSAYDGPKRKVLETVEGTILRIVN
jgi:integrase